MNMILLISPSYHPSYLQKDPPQVRGLKVYEKIKKLKNTSQPITLISLINWSGIPGNMHHHFVTEFAPEIATLVCTVYNSIIRTAKQGIALWPKHWKIEYGTPIKKVEVPLSEDDLRVISLTPFLSKVFERFVVNWLRKYIGHKIDPKQFGDGKGNSTSHYLVELTDFILHNQDMNPPNAVLLAMVDFSKAYNRQNHNTLITKLSDLGVPGWLLNLVMGYLKDRHMLIRFRGEESKMRPLPGGGPQGGLLGALLFISLVNECEFDQE